MTDAGRWRFQLDRGARLLGGGTVLVGGSPGRVVRLTPAGAAVLGAALRGSLDEPGPQEEALLERLAEAGLVHRRPEPGTAAGRRTTAVIPARDEGRRVATLVKSIRDEVAAVIVVDDGSSDATAEAATGAGATVISHQRPRGPAAARNTGLRAVETELAALIDADCVPPGLGWLDALAAEIGAGASLVGPRVVGGAGEGRWGRLASLYEAESGPLDMGPRRSRVGPGRRVSFVPSAVMLARAGDLLEVGGFDETLRYGEDVDLIFRLDQAGRSCRYEPGVTFRHRPRPGPRGFLEQRFRYGRSAAELDRRHPGEVAPLRATPLSLAAALSVPFAGPLGIAAVAPWSGRRLAAKTGLARRQATAVALEAQLAGAAGLGRALAREWLPLTALLLATPRLRRLALLPLGALLADELSERGPAVTAGKAGLGLAARAAYAAGLWSAAIRSRRPGAVLPSRNRAISG